MEQRGLLLRGIARVLNAGGSALLDIYDAATSMKISVLPGEKGNLKARLKEYEKKVERLYYEIGKEVAQREFTTRTSAAGEAGIKLVAEYRVKIEKIKQRIKEIEEEEKAAKEAAIDSAGARAKPAPEPIEDAGEPAASESPEAGEVSTGPVTEEVTEEAKETVAEAAETPEHELQKDTAGPEAPESDEASPGGETKGEASTKALETMLKADLLRLCMEKGIEADKRMTKAEIIALILGRS